MAKRNSKGQFVKGGGTAKASKPRKAPTTPSGAPAITLTDSQLAQVIKTSGIDLGGSGGFVAALGRYPQTGVSNRRRDKLIKALPPGWRESKTGRTYFENRRNRSDRNLNKRL